MVKQRPPVGMVRGQKEHAMTCQRCGRPLTADDTAHKCEACELDADKSRARAGGDVFGIADDEREGDDQ